MLKEFVKQEARPLPVILLLDVSGSMGGEKIESLNKAVKDMISAFADEESTQAEIHVGIITFGGETANVHIPLTPAQKVEWKNLSASGRTPLGGALKVSKDMIEDREIISSRSYRPSVILVSDGMPTDNYEGALNAFIHEGRSAKCDRWAMWIGQDANLQVLEDFINDPEKKVYQAQDAHEIHKFFRLVTMTTTSRTRSSNPNVVSTKDDIDTISKKLSL
jgi:uncharacterized protein YegL